MNERVCNGTADNASCTTGCAGSIELFKDSCMSNAT